jgi:hypothetical protein
MALPVPVRRERLAKISTPKHARGTGFFTDVFAARRNGNRVAWVPKPQTPLGKIVFRFSACSLKRGSPTEGLAKLGNTLSALCETSRHSKMPDSTPWVQSFSTPGLMRPVENSEGAEKHGDQQIPIPGEGKPLPQPAPMPFSADHWS